MAFYYCKLVLHYCKLHFTRVTLSCVLKHLHPLKNQGLLLFAGSKNSYKSCLQCYTMTTVPLLMGKQWSTEIDYRHMAHYDPPLSTLYSAINNRSSSKGPRFSVNPLVAEIFSPPLLNDFLHFLRTNEMPPVWRNNPGLDQWNRFIPRNAQFSSK